MKWTVIGRGSNLLVLDEGIRGVVIKLGAGLDHLELEGEQVTVGGGYSVVRLATSLSKKGLSGLEFAAGIPGSVGGAVYMNAGAHGSDMSEILVKAHILFEDGTIEWLTNEQMDFSYRTSVLQRNARAFALKLFCSLSRRIRNQSFSKCKAIKTIEKYTAVFKPLCGKHIQKSASESCREPCRKSRLERISNRRCKDIGDARKLHRQCGGSISKRCA